jgi:predicted SnoaL-like aldol condensation-catalyzing enzyme
MSAINQLEANKHLVLDVLTPELPPVFVLAEHDLVTVCWYMPQPEPGAPAETYDYFAFETFRVRDGELVERWPNTHRYVPVHQPPDAAVGRDRVTAPGDVGATDLEANKRLVWRFYTDVLGPRNPEAVSELVAVDYHQHVSHMPQGRAGLEAFVRVLAEAASRDGRPAGDGSLPEPAVLLAEGDMVVIAGCLPQPEPDGSGATWPYYAYDAYRVREGKLAEHWSGINKAAPPQHG